MKKLITFILVLSLVLGLGATAFAQEEYDDNAAVTIYKDLTLANEDTENPAETFTFKIGAGTGERDGNPIPAPEFNPNQFTITFSQGQTSGSADLTLPEFTQVGVYTYTLTEEEGSTAGMRYDSGEYRLVVTVINNPDYEEGSNEPKFLRVLTLTDENNLKDDSFKNEFYAGSLTVRKQVTGNFGDPDDKFEVTVTLSPKEGKELKADPIQAPGADSFSQDPETGAVTIKYTVKDGSEFTISNIPYDVLYNVEEAQAEEYDEPVYDGNQSGEMDAPSKETTITNNRDIDIETGVNLDSLPYFAILALAIGGLAMFLVRRRAARI